MHPAEPLAILVTALSAAVALAVTAALTRAAAGAPRLRPVARRAAALLWLWWGAAVALSVNGFFAAPDRFGWADLPGFAAFGTAMTLPVAGLVLAVRRGGDFAALVARVPTGWLVGVQVFRLGGLAFVALWAAGRVPDWLGLVTGAMDVAVGLAALQLGLALARGAAWARRAAVGWSLFGLADFASAIGFVFLAFLGLVAVTPAPAMIGLHPLALIALFQVPLAVALHLAVLARLMPRAVAAGA